MLDGGRLFNFKDKVNDQYTDLYFGKWSFESNHPSPQKINKSDSGTAKNNFLDIDIIFNTPYNVISTFVLYNSMIHVKAFAPGKIPFSIHFSFADSMFEQYLEKRYSSKKINYHSIHFWKEAHGYVSTSANHSLPFNVKIFYQDSALQPTSALIAGMDTIFINPVWEVDPAAAAGRECR